MPALDPRVGARGHAFPCVWAELRAELPAYLARHAEIEAANRFLEPYFAEILRRAGEVDLGFTRYAGAARPPAGRGGP
jgi:hypothetical protein